MSYNGVIATACLGSDSLPSSLARIEDLEGVYLDERTSIVVCSRNGWLNNRVEEIARTFSLSSIPMQGKPTIVLGGMPLQNAIAELQRALDLLVGNPARFPQPSLGYIKDEEVQAILMVTPKSLAAAIDDLKIASSHDEDGQSFEILVRFLWCQLRLAEHASAHHLWLVSALWPHDG